MGECKGKSSLPFVCQIQPRFLSMCKVPTDRGLPPLDHWLKKGLLVHWHASVPYSFFPHSSTHKVCFYGLDLNTSFISFFFFTSGFTLSAFRQPRIWSWSLRTLVLPSKPARVHTSSRGTKVVVSDNAEGEIKSQWLQRHTRGGLSEILSCYFTLWNILGSLVKVSS